MSSQENSNNNSANVIADEIRFAPGKLYGSQHEYWNDARDPRYRSDSLFHSRVEDKFLRSFSGAAGAEGVRPISASGNVKFAQATRGADGTIQSVQIGMDGKPIGDNNGGSNEGNGSAGAVSSGVQVRTLSGGTRSVTLRSGDASEVKKQLPKERQPVSRMTFSQHNGTR